MEVWSGSAKKYKSLRVYKCLEVGETEVRPEKTKKKRRKEKRMKKYKPILKVQIQSILNWKQFDFYSS